MQRLAPDVIFQKMIEGLAGVKDEAQRAALSTIIFSTEGERAGLLLELAANGGFAAARKRLEDLGGTTDGNIRKITKYGVLLGDVVQVIQAQFTSAIIDLGDEFGFLTKNTDGLIKATGELVRGIVIKGVKGFISLAETVYKYRDALEAVLYAWLAFKAASLTGAVLQTMQMLGRAFILMAAAAGRAAVAFGAIALKIGVIVGLGAIVGNLAASVVQSWDTIKEAGSTLVQFLTAGWESFAAKTKEIFARIVQGFVDFINSIIQKFNAIPGVADIPTIAADFGADAIKASQDAGKAVEALGQKWQQLKGDVSSVSTEIGGNFNNNIKTVFDTVVAKFKEGREALFEFLQSGGAGLFEGLRQGGQAAREASATGPGDGVVRGSRIVGAGTANPLGQIDLVVGPLAVGFANALAKQFATMAQGAATAGAKFKEYALSFTDNVLGALQGSLQAGTFKGFLKKILSGFVQNLQQAIQGAFGEGGSGQIGGFGGFLRGIFSGSFHDGAGREVQGTPGATMLAKVKVGEEIYKKGQGPRQMVSGDININLPVADLSQDWRRNLRREAYMVGEIVREVEQEPLAA